MQRQLSQLESARKKFIATASHELRTPLFSLGGFVELLEDDDLDAETRRRFLDQVRDQVERLRKLSVDLLDLSRLEAGSLELREEQVDLGELTRSVSGEFEPTLAQHDSHLELRLGRTRSIDAVCDPGPRRPDRADPDRQRADPHATRARGSSSPPARDNGLVRLAVRDDGEGIDAARDAADLRAVLHRRRRAGLGARTRDRRASWPSGCRGGCGALGTRRDGLHARDPLVNDHSCPIRSWSLRAGAARDSACCSHARFGRRAGRAPASAPGAIVTFAIDAVAESALEELLAERAPRVAFYSEDRGLVADAGSRRTC